MYRAECERTIGAHLHAGPAVVVMRGGHHRHARHLERKLREIGHGRERQSDVVHAATRRHQSRRQCRLHRSRIGAEIVSGHDLRRDAELVNERAEPEPQRLHAHQVELLFEQPAHVVFAKAGGLHQRF